MVLSGMRGCSSWTLGGEIGRRGGRAKGLMVPACRHWRPAGHAGPSVCLAAERTSPIRLRRPHHRPCARPSSWLSNSPQHLEAEDEALDWPQRPRLLRGLPRIVPLFARDQESPVVAPPPANNGFGCDEDGERSNYKRRQATPAWAKYQQICDVYPTPMFVIDKASCATASYSQYTPPLT